MTWSSARSQKVTYALILILSGVTALLAYPLVYPDRSLFRQGEHAWQAGRESDAMSLYAQALANGLNRSHALYRMVTEALQAGDMPLAEQALARLTDNASRARLRASDLLPVAGALDAAGRYDLASALLEHHANLFPEDWSSALYRADLLRRSQRYDDAEGIYRAVRDAAPAQVARVAALQWAEMLGWQERFAAAEELLREQLDADPLDRDARILFGRILFWSGRLDEAISEYQQALGETK
ncbi:tetratricopeptide repeat protein [Thiocapsa rosea]|uniref:Tetratricopeptide repeat protein n=1 Tax=Thiocapsa rosea TaxID=69360 RepID=A0A495VFI2_9GAMM|nr:tetratricopeptide repeat protein [Thiocapsa rosea]RKT46588.1 tetratricopeptide repeat protein [Thiocapsa rosea]